MSTSIINKKNILIAGPCSAESEEQLITTSKELKATGVVDVLRAGIWKPRTNPGGYEGPGKEGLNWLLSAKKETNLPIATEVATPEHIEEALKHEVDILWIGARTTVNPFSVQEIADCLKGTKATVLIKNPINPDLKLWIGAIERLLKAGIEDLGLIHRGFSAYGNSEFRNLPMWQIPIEMKRLFSELPLICDPSHICGRRSNLTEVMQRSIDLDFNGLIVESHTNPEFALTDKDQQLKPSKLLDIYENLFWKTSSSEEINYTEKLAQFREQINAFDDELLSLIAARMKVSEKIGQLKKESRVTVLQSNRWNEILGRMTTKASKFNLSREFVQAYMEALHVESIRIQETII